MEKRYYVYELIDPRDNVAFYVGKGCGNRDRSHITEARKGAFKNPAKIAMIRFIESLGLEVVIQRVATGLTESDALKAERARIAEHGIANLTNMVRGQLTDADRDEAIADDGLLQMWHHITQILNGVRYSVDEIKMIFAIIRELREALALLPSDRPS